MIFLGCNRPTCVQVILCIRGSANKNILSYIDGFKDLEVAYSREVEIYEDTLKDIIRYSFRNINLESGQGSRYVIM